MGFIHNLIHKLFIQPYILQIVLTWDVCLFFLNLILPSYKPGEVVPTGAPGHGMTWPPYEPPSSTDSRSACPMLNALANHNILPHSGREISFRDLSKVVRQTFNFSPSFSFFVPQYAAEFLKRSYWTGKFDLEDLSRHNKIEHDASLTRRDAALVPDQGVPDKELVEELLSSATGEGGALLTKKDLSLALSRRRVEARRTNDKYTSSLFHRGFGSANSSTMLTIFGGRVDDLRPMLLEERFAQGWEPRVRKRFGLTMTSFNATVLPVERGVNEKAYVKLMEREREEQGKSVEKGDMAK
ncbi:Cloroperoxidase [Massarina eburnea CBS 473.64]|uniref:Cloroperoxidase n=1 Tax=Massarina eburnea CBS 473.64 TaxID=1395130 RepID=A0A6A6SKF9_9PLEO|nr:Cloroperoxidase [Massarina eburnea CBS 473.64]